MPQTHSTDAQLDYWHSLLEVLHLAADEWCFICPSGLGDTYLVCALGPEFLRENDGCYFSVIVKEEYWSIPQLFPRAVHQTITLEQLDMQAIHLFSRFEPGIPILVHPHYQPKEIKELLLGTRGITPISLYRSILRLPPEAPVAKPTITQTQRWSAGRRFTGQGLLQGRTVILAPDSNSEMPLPSMFWLQLSSALSIHGYCVATLINPGWTQVLPGTAAARFPLAEIIPAAELAGWVIAARTGLCEILSSAHCRLSIVYPNIPRQDGTVLSAFSLRRMGLSDRVMEYEAADASSFHLLIEDILSDE